MKTKYIKLLSWFFVALIVSCSSGSDDTPDKPNEGPEKIDTKTIEKVLQKASTEWGSSKSAIQQRMDGYFEIANETDFLQYQEPNSQLKISYQFKSNTLCTTAIMLPSSSDAVDLSPYLNGYQYVGIIDDAKIYGNTSANTFAASYSLKEAEMQVVGFTPIKSSAFETIELLEVITGTASAVKHTTATVSGSVKGVTAQSKVGVQYSTTTEFGSKETKDLQVSSSASFSVELSNLDIATTYYYRVYAVEDGLYTYGATKSFTTKDLNFEEVVDLGLSVKWRAWNVGASSPEEYGDYFAWGETTTKNTYKWSTYKHCNGSYTTLNKYNNSSSHGTVDNKTVLELEDDVAHVKLAGTWRIPTYDEFDELKTKCIWRWIIYRGVKGYFVQGSNGGTIFLPAAGCRSGSSLRDAGSYGYYWSSSLDTSYSNYAYYVRFNSSNVDWGNDGLRYVGQSVRAVCP